MDYMINFPNLGIHLSHVGKNVTIGGFTIAWLAYKEKLPQGPFPKGEKVKFNNTTKKK